MVAEDGAELYVELEHDPSRHSDFTRNVVMPQMRNEPVTRERAAELVQIYLARFDPRPELVCDFIGDWWLLLELVPNLAELAIPRWSRRADTGAALAAMGKPGHNALDDARALMMARPGLRDF